MSKPKRGEIYIVDFDPAVGSEIKKTRPAVIIQNDIANEFSPITIVGAITSDRKNQIHHTGVLVVAGEGGLSKNSIIQLNQIRMIDKKRLGEKLGDLSKETISKINQALKISLDIDGIVSG